MISVFLNEYHYKFNGKFGVLTNMINGKAVILDKQDTDNCNKSDRNILKLIEIHKSYLYSE